MEQGKIMNLLPQEAQNILCIRPSKLGAEDSHILLSNKAGGKYSINTGYHIVLARNDLDSEELTTKPQIDWMKDIWLLPIPPKIRVFLWKIVKGALPLGGNLESRGLITNVQCAYCGMKETADQYNVVLRRQYGKKSLSASQPANPLEKTSSQHSEDQEEKPTSHLRDCGLAL